MAVKYALLGLLLDGPLHGYELKAAYEDELVPEGQLNFGQVYKTLERLGRDGLVSCDTVRQSERPDKKVYSLTAAGRRVLRKWLRAPSTPGLDLRNETFLKLMVARRVRGGDPLALVAVERRAAFERLHEVTRSRSEPSEDAASWQRNLILDLAALRLEAFVKWLDRCEDVFREEKP